MNDWPFILRDFVNSANIGMVQSGRRTRFPAEALQRLRVFGNIVRQKLQSHHATELRVLSLVHYPHATTAQLLDNAVVRNGLADQ